MPKSFRRGVLALIPAAAMSVAYAGDDDITLIHTGDFHGHLVPRANARADGNGKMEGGLARIYTVIQKIRAEQKNSLLLHTGDTIQGGAEVLYTRGDAMIDVLNNFGIDAFAPGNWEFVYGSARFLELFGGDKPKAKWDTVAANVMFSTKDGADWHAMPPYVVKNAGNVKVGILGMTTDRGPQVVGKTVTAGLSFLKNQKQPGEELSQVDRTVKKYVNQLRKMEKVDIVVMLSELGLANNLRIAEGIPGIDVILSSDMHEETQEAIVATNKETGGKTLIAEEGQDGTMMGQINLSVKGGKIAKWEWIPHNINDSIAEDPKVAKQIADIRKTFVAGPDFKQHVNPFNGTKLQRPIDTVVGQTKTALHRSNFSDDAMPGVIEGSAHDFLADAFRAVTGAQIGAIRGFRYGTHVMPGPIKLEDLYHYIPIGPQIAVAKISGKQLKGQIENAADGSINSNVSEWTGGWLFNFSGVTMNLDPYAEKGKRVSGLKIEGAEFKPEETPAYTYASYWYSRDPCLVNVIEILECKDEGTPGNPKPSNITVLVDKDGNPMDGTEVVVKYLESLPEKTADTKTGRIKLLKPLPVPPKGFRVIQPLRGANETPAPIETATKN
jgi:2',3'-cyclic-nucleotide 2'-phosphodiesterase (5'-nucleotidase family)